MDEEDWDNTADENLSYLNSPSAPVGMLRDEIAALIAALRASRAENDRLRGFLDDQARKQFEAEVYQEWKAQQ